MKHLLISPKTALWLLRDKMMAVEWLEDNPDVLRVLRSVIATVNVRCRNKNSYTTENARKAANKRHHPKAK